MQLMSTSSKRVGNANPTVLITVLCSCGLLASFMMSLVVPIVGKLPEYLHTSSENALWVVTATLLAAAVIVPISGRLADMFGKRRVILFSIGSMIVGSVICGLFDSLGPMIIGRALQGIAAGVIPVGISLLRDELPPHRVSGAIATMSATLGVGGAIGMPIAAYIPQHFHWQVLFWVCAVLAVIVFATVLIFVAESPHRTPGSFDTIGTVLMTIGLICVLLAISKGKSWGWTGPITLGLGLGGVVVLLIWGAHELRAKTPLVNLRLAGQRKVLLTNLASIFTGFSLMGLQLAASPLMQTPHVPGALDFGMGQSMLMTGWWLVPGGLTMMLMSPVSSRLIERFGPRYTLMLGGSVIGIGYLSALALIHAPWQLMLAAIITFGGVGIAYSAMPALIMGAVPVSEMGSANGFNSLMRSIGTSVASALMATVLTSSVVHLAGNDIPDLTAYRLVFILGFAAAAIAVALTVAIPRDNKSAKVVEIVEEPVAVAAD